MIMISLMMTLYDGNRNDDDDINLLPERNKCFSQFFMNDDDNDYKLSAE